MKRWLWVIFSLTGIGFVIWWQKTSRSLIELTGRRINRVWYFSLGLLLVAIGAFVYLYNPIAQGQTIPYDLSRLNDALYLLLVTICVLALVTFFTFVLSAYHFCQATHAINRKLPVSLLFILALICPPAHLYFSQESLDQASLVYKLQTKWGHLLAVASFYIFLILSLPVLLLAFDYYEPKKALKVRLDVYALSLAMEQNPQNHNLIHQIDLLHHNSRSIAVIDFNDWSGPHSGHGSLLLVIRGGACDQSQRWGVSQEGSIAIFYEMSLAFDWRCYDFESNWPLEPDDSQA